MAIPIDLLISDVNMPEHDGCTLVEWIRNDETLRDLGVVMLTSGARPGDVQRCEELHIAARLMKPVIQAELLDAIGLALGREAEPGCGSGDGYVHRRRTTLPPLRILLAEDSLVNQKLAIGLLEKYGHSMVVAENGQEALAQYATDLFDVILMDIEMPLLDGLETTLAIRQRERAIGTTHSHHRHDRTRHERRPGTVPGRRHGCVRLQADSG